MTLFLVDSRLPVVSASCHTPADHGSVPEAGIYRVTASSIPLCMLVANAGRHEPRRELKTEELSELVKAGLRG
jgi:hypothetical protein